MIFLSHIKPPTTTPVNFQYFIDLPQFIVGLLAASDGIYISYMHFLQFERFVTFYFNLVSKVLLKLWHDYFPVVRRSLQRAWDTLAIWVPRVYSRAQELALNTAKWFYNLSPDFFDAIADGFRRLANEVVTKTPHILALVQEYLLTAWTLLVSYISDVVLWLKKNVI